MFDCTVRPPNTPNGLAPYIIGGGGDRLFRTQSDLVQHGMKEILMEASNKMKNLGIDPSPLLTLTRFANLKDGTLFTCRLPPSNGTEEDMDSLLNWHVRTSQLFLLKLLPQKTNNLQGRDGRSSSPDFKDLFDKLMASHHSLPQFSGSHRMKIDRILSVETSGQSQVIPPSLLNSSLLYWFPYSQGSYLQGAVHRWQAGHSSRAHRVSFIQYKSFSFLCINFS